MSTSIDTRLLDSEEKETLANLLWRYYYEKKMLKTLPTARYLRYDKVSYEDERKDRDIRIGNMDDAFSTFMYELEIYDGVDVGGAVREKRKTL